MNNVARKRPGVMDLAQNFIGEAQKKPHLRPQIFRKAAQTFIGLAQDPKNAHVARRLQDVAAQFAEASRVVRASIEDFTELLEETAEAYEDVEGSSDMDVIAQRRQIHGKDIQQISISPVTFDGDSTSLGRVGTFKHDPTDFERAQGVKQQDTVAFWQGHKPEAQAISVDIGLVTPPPPPEANALTVANARPFAKIVYGSDGATTEAIVDVGMGRRLTVVGSYLSVLIGMDPPKSGNTSGTLEIGASIGTFAAPSQAPVTRTVYIDGLSPVGPDNVTDLIQIPLKATMLLPVLSNLTGGTVTISFFGIGGGAAPLATATYPIGGTPGAVPTQIPGDCVFFSLTNNTASLSDFRVMFQLSL